MGFIGAKNVVINEAEISREIRVGSISSKLPSVTKALFNHRIRLDKVQRA